METEVLVYVDPSCGMGFLWILDNVLHMNLLNVNLKLKCFVNFIVTFSCSYS